MKIVHITKKYDNIVGGDAIVVKNLRNYQIAQKDTVAIITSNVDNIINAPYLYKFGLKIDENDLDHINLKRIISLFFLFFYSFYLLKKIKPDIVHSHSVDMGFIISFACRFYRIPILATFHNGFSPNTNNLLYKKILENIFIKIAGFKTIITVNHEDSKRINNKDVVFIPNGVDTKLFKPMPKQSNNIIKVIYVGRLVRLKGLKYLISAMQILNVKNIKSELLLVGSGDYKSAILKQIAKFKLTNITILEKNSQKELAEKYAQADMLVLPSIDQEGFGLVILEALASGTPVITTDVSGLVYYLKKYNCGLVIPDRSAKKIVDAILKLHSNKMLVTSIIKNGAKMIHEKFTWQKVSKDTSQVYKKILYENTK